MFKFQKRIALFSIFLIFCNAIILFASSDITQIDLIFDASGSMWGQIDGKTKIEIAREALGSLLDEFNARKDVQLSLRVYGHLNKECDNSVVEIPMSENNCDAIKTKIKSIKPTGKTPIAFSLEHSISDFNKDISGEKIIVLITDGIESCDGDICTVAQKLKDAGIVTQMHIIGFGMDENQLASMKCIAAPFDGKVLGAGNANELTDAFKKISKETYSHNLEIRAIDDDGKKVLVDYVVRNIDGADIEKGDNSMADGAKVSLAPGVYNIYVTNNQTGDEIKLSNVNVNDDSVVKKDLIFAQRTIHIKVKDGQGNSKLVDVYLYDESGEQIKYADTSMGGQAEFNIMPGIYSIVVDDYSAGKKIKLDNIDLIKNKSFEKEVVFE